MRYKSDKLLNFEYYADCSYLVSQILKYAVLKHETRNVRYIADIRNKYCIRQDVWMSELLQALV